MNDSQSILKLSSITKKFPGVLALDQVDFDLKKGEVHALVGENGAGKSTLIKIISGVHKRDGGEIEVKGEKVNIKGPRHSRELGISVIYQEFNLVPYLSIAENIFLGREQLKGNTVINKNEMYNKSSEILHDLGINLDPDTIIADLGVAMQQMVEIAKALSMDSDIIIMDEPTAALGENEIEELFKTIENLKKKGISIIYISHRLKELWEVADRVTVFRDGQYIATHPISETDKDLLINEMVGRELKEQFPPRKIKIDNKILEVKNLATKKLLKNISFSLNKGEILGFAGLVGSGRTELMRCIFGADPKESGKILIDNQEVEIQNPQDAIEKGIGFITEDRKKQGLVLVRSVRENISLTDLSQVMNGIVLQKDKDKKLAEAYIKKLNIKTPGSEQEVKYLSGGNQQKVVLAKWLIRDTKILIFDEPTRGIDVGAKKEVYSLMNQLAENGVGIIMISSELPEILGMSDRIMVMNHGKIAGKLDIDEADQEKILSLATRE
ncbi:ribose transport system ATP-binding protein [Halanaerobium saccharolyticum]|uniref:Ribose transport system ATP-binding protein n=1 Tax=Halanaerobium saccharolyticum TaxID=43595 RepID=A0A4R7YXS1_9FIRM|nr:sugar ABC transporter ATP-binding protein [Halanaerobium saccharolyticum]RAK07213.1 ribose transport system ATP-binding protein [Halanaerobium saccharolyticum]TDW02126.1 ribose transport system ATP-binding protein [Halanaerobium saccharolyticum]TDX58857.1 ribose transport system ATP-binding protein [Halanaerobium saccharolyticum]